MIDVLPAPSHVAAFRVSGTLTTGDYQRMFGEVESKLKTHERVGLFADARALHGVKPSALAKDLAYAFGEIGELRRFPRAAVVGEKPWLRTLTRAGNALFRTIELRAFPDGEESAALAWVSELPDEPRVPALRLIPTNRSDVVAFAWNGTISPSEAAELVRTCERALERHERIRLLGRIERLGGIVPGAFARSGLAAFKWRARHKIDRYAVVGGGRLLDTWIKTVPRLFRVEVRRFDLDQEDAAWAWIEASPVKTDGA